MTTYDIEQAHLFLSIWISLWYILWYSSNYLTSHLDAGYSIDVFILTLVKPSIDSVPHQWLLYKLTKLGIHGKLLKWIENLLTNEHQCVMINGLLSYPSPGISGIPQGPLLFLMFVDDLSSVVSSSIFMFADDTKILWDNNGFIALKTI